MCNMKKIPAVFNTNDFTQVELTMNLTQVNENEISNSCLINNISHSISKATQSNIESDKLEIFHPFHKNQQAGRVSYELQ